MGGPVLKLLIPSFQSRTFLEIDQAKTIIACGGHVCFLIGARRVLV
jgi:hypothetical protein